MAKLRNPLAEVRSTTMGIVALTVLWTGFQVWDKSPPPVLDQVLVAAFGIWFATEAKYNSSKRKKNGGHAEDEDD